MGFLLPICEDLILIALVCHLTSLEQHWCATWLHSYSTDVPLDFTLIVFLCHGFTTVALTSLWLQSNSIGVGLPSEFTLIALLCHLSSEIICATWLHSYSIVMPLDIKSSRQFPSPNLAGCSFLQVKSLYVVLSCLHILPPMDRFCYLEIFLATLAHLWWNTLSSTHHLKSDSHFLFLKEKHLFCLRLCHTLSNHPCSSEPQLFCNCLVRHSSDHLYCLWFDFSPLWLFLKKTLTTAQLQLPCFQ